MISSSILHRGRTLRLTLVGHLDDYSAHALVREYYERFDKGIQECQLDLSAADYADPDGLNVIHRLELLTEGAEVALKVRCDGSPVRTEIERALVT
jgi:anti-anti-sigma regulatory factor